MTLLSKPVIVTGIESNGSSDQAAVITREWGKGDKLHLVNLTVFPDCATPLTRGSVYLYDSEAEARQAYADAVTKMPVCWLAT